MTDFFAPDVSYKEQHAGTWGNLAVASGSYNVNLDNGDRALLARIPKGCKLVDAAVAMDAAAGTGCLADLGYVHVDGSGGDDDDYFTASPVDIDGTTLYRKDTPFAPVELAKDSWLAFTVSGADFDAAHTINWWVTYEYVGQP